jgi:hypothetical protein
MRLRRILLFFIASSKSSNKHVRGYRIHEGWEFAILSDYWERGCDMVTHAELSPSVRFL